MNEYNGAIHQNSTIHTGGNQRRQTVYTKRKTAVFAVFSHTQLEQGLKVELKTCEEQWIMDWFFS